MNGNVIITIGDKTKVQLNPMLLKNYLKADMMIIEARIDAKEML